MNALRHGVLAGGVLKSRGLERCPVRHSCQAVRDLELRSACRPGVECPVERAIHDAYIDSARVTFSFCRPWLSESEFERTIAELAIVTLQRQRLSALVAREGFTRAKVHPVSGITYGVEESLSAGRYATKLDNKYGELMHRILDDPRETEETCRHDKGAGHS